MHTKVFQNVSPYPNIIRVIKSRRERDFRGHAEHMRTIINTYIFVGKPDRKKLLGKPRRRREDNINTDIEVRG
jgi:hypothetical protein